MVWRLVSIVGLTESIAGPPRWKLGFLSRMRVTAITASGGILP